MKIQGLPITESGLKSIGHKRSEKTPSDKPEKSDTVELSQSVRNGDVEVKSPNNVPADFPARVERVKSIAQHIGDETYITPEVSEKVAERIIDSEALKDTVSSLTNGETEITPVRSEMVNEAQDNILQNYYNQPEVVEEIAGRLIDALGLSSLF